MSQSEFKKVALKFQEAIVDLAIDLDIKIVATIEVYPLTKEEYNKCGSITLKIKPID